MYIIIRHHNHYYYNVISMIVLLLVTASVRVRSAPLLDPKICQDDTAELQRNSFSIVEQIEDLDLWADEQRTIPDNVCVSQSGTKTTCNLDYVNATESSDWCLSVPNTLYVETTWIYKCENTDNKKHIFYAVRNRPACYSSSCYDGYDKSVLEGLERTTFKSLNTELLRPNTDSEWGDTNGFDTCVEIRLAITDPIFSEILVNADGLDGTVTALTASPTISPAPTTSSPPTDGPTLTRTPTASPAPTEAPKELSCRDESAVLIADNSNVKKVKEMGSVEGDNVFGHHLGVHVGLTNIQDLMMIDTDTGKGFEKYCYSTLEDSNKNNTENVNITTLCEFGYDEVIANTTDTEISIAALCHDANGVYVEDSVSITCASVEGNSSVNTRFIITNKPSCRSKVCNADGIHEVATTEFDRWMKLTLENGMEEALATIIDAQGSATTTSIMSGPQSCVIDTEDDNDNREEGVVVAVGGSILSNNGGKPIEPTDVCQDFTNAVDGNINVYNQKSIFQRELLDFVDTDMRMICGSPEPDVLECNFDWSEIFETTTTTAESSQDRAKASAETLKSVCMPDGSGSSGAGQYVESTFRVTCSNLEGQEMTMTNTNVPGCVGRPCTAGQAEYLFDGDYTYLADFFILKGWDCTTKVLSVYTPHYDAFFGTYSVDDMASNPQFDVVDVVDEEKESDVSVVLENVDNGDNNYPQFDIYNGPVVTDNNNKTLPTPPPTSNLHLRGPKYEVLFVTDPPTSSPKHPITLGTSASSPSRFPAGTTGSTTTVLLLLLPLTLSMLLL